MIVNEIAAAAPNARISVWTFEAFAGRPRRQFNMLTGRIDVARGAQKWQRVCHAVAAIGCRSQTSNVL